MKFNKILKMIFTALILAFAFGCSDSDSDKAKDYKLTIAHVSDTHAHVEPTEVSLKFDGTTTTKVKVGGFAKLASEITLLRNDKNLLFLHAGDMFQGTLFFTQYKGIESKELFGDMGLDVMTLGNHEFDDANQTLTNFVNSTVGNFDFVSANINFSSEPALQSKVSPYKIIEKDGGKIGVIGITTVETPTISSPGNLQFSNEKTAVENAVAELKNQGINKIVVLSHAGYDTDIEIAESVSDIDVIVGGHDHYLMGDHSAAGLTNESAYPMVFDHDGVKTLYVTSWEWAKVLGVLDITFDEDGKIKTYNGKSLLLMSDIQTDYTQKNSEGTYVAVNDSIWNSITSIVNENADLVMIAEDATMASRIAELKEPIQQLYEVKVADVNEDLWHVRVPGTEHPTAGLLEHGSYIAPIVCDGMLWKANDFGYNADIAIQNAGGVRVDIESGDLTVGRVYELMPFGNTLAILDIKGSDLKNVLEEAIEGAIGTKGTGAFPYVAGCKFTAKASNAAGERIISLEIGSDNSGWTDYDPLHTYRIVTNAFIGTGGDGYASFANNSYYYDSGNVDAEVFQSYCEHMGSLSRNPEVRVTLEY
ncbi:MAG: bifunctional metallophosphatase/5'-nucleotidase [Candidatus Delongbacteria bacterium]|nr:bifunctional metallophosphatase/5'-nucleotidase [Candidatus Delongbacteria bacterium]MBN2836204.1 bifunctional metallophosphatase/5'-nucleotidase [Candidatus Delongbacteria bacterium]